MIRPILACENPYAASKVFAAAGWKIDFSQPIESGDPLVGVSLENNAVLLGITQGYVPKHDMPYIGCGVILYLTVPTNQIQTIHQAHQQLNPSEIQVQSWGDSAFEVEICGYKFMIAAEQKKASP